MKGILLIWMLSCLAIGGIEPADINFPTADWEVQPNVCEDVPEGRVPWIMYVRNADYGWYEHTHRANIALAVNRYRGVNEADVKKIQLQLEMEVLKALFRNGTSVIHENDLALYIHALLAVGKNPRDFYCTDLVGDLLHRVDSAIRARKVVHPFLVLALCNSGVVTFDHLLNIRNHTHHDHDSQHVDLDGRAAELKALALKAYACGAEFDKNLNKFQVEISRAVDCLRGRQERNTDGSFGNVYTTSLAVQALIAADHGKPWDKQRALAFLEQESKIKVNMIKAYYIEMALNAPDVKFIRDLYRGPLTTCKDPVTLPKHDFQYTIKNSSKPVNYFSLTMAVDPTLNFFDIMNEAWRLSPNFSFKYTLNSENVPMIHTVAGIPNDAEENTFWTICRQTRVDHNVHTSEIETFHGSPKRFIPVNGEHVILSYLDQECPR